MLTMPRVADIKTPLQLYRHLCRCVRELPLPVQAYYKHHIRQVCFAFQFYCTQTWLYANEMLHIAS